MELEAELDHAELQSLLNDSALRCYHILITEGIEELEKSGQGVIKTLDNLIRYFESQEDYTKCAELLKIKNSYET